MNTAHLKMPIEPIKTAIFDTSENDRKYVKAPTVQFELSRW